MAGGVQILVYLSRVDTRLGTFEITASERGIIGISSVCSFVRGYENNWTRRGAEQLLEYTMGCRGNFDVPLDLSGTPFQRSVWQELCRIPFGKSVSYSEIAERIGRPAAARAVAQAIGRNPCLIIIPCHRVLGKNGSLTGFSAGLELKRALLDLEGISWID